MKLVVIAPAYYQTTTPIAALVESCDMLGIPLEPYGLGESYVGWIAVKVHGLIPVLQGLLNRGYTYVVYTDGQDAFCLAPIGEIREKYEALGRPDILLSAERDCYPMADQSFRFPETTVPSRFINAGGFMGRIECILDRLQFLREKYFYERHQLPAYWKEEYRGNDQAWWNAAFIEGELPGAVIDTDCEIFQTVSGMHMGRDLVMEQGRIRNTITTSQPCVLHFNGRSPGLDHIFTLWRSHRR